MGAIAPDRHRCGSRFAAHTQAELGLTAMWETAEKWKVGAECYYTGRQRLDENPYRSWSTLRLFGFLASRQLGPVSLFVNVENLGNVRRTKWNSMLRPNRAADGRWTVDAWAPLDGRVVNGGLRFRFDLRKSHAAHGNVPIVEALVDGFEGLVGPCRAQRDEERVVMFGRGDRHRGAGSMVR